MFPFLWIGFLWRILKTWYNDPKWGKKDNFSENILIQQYKNAYFCANQTLPEDSQAYIAWRTEKHVYEFVLAILEIPFPDIDLTNPKNMA